jgi:hypothetical protein
MGISSDVVAPRFVMTAGALVAAVAALIIGSTLVAWSVVLPRVGVRRALRVHLVAMLGVSAGLFVLNHASGWPTAARWTLTGAVPLLVMTERASRHRRYPCSRRRSV